MRLVSRHGTSITSVGTAFPLAVCTHQSCVVTGKRRLWLLTARHVVWPEGSPTTPPTELKVDFPSAVNVAWRGGPFDANVAFDPKKKAPDAPSQDWVLLEAELPADVEPWPWTLLDRAELHRLHSGGTWPIFYAEGYPTRAASAARDGVGNDLHRLVGRVEPPIVRSNVIHLVLYADSGKVMLLNARGLSGGPVRVEERLVGLIVEAFASDSKLLGQPVVAGTIYALPLAPIVEVLSEAGFDLPSAGVLSAGDNQHLVDAAVALEDRLGREQLDVALVTALQMLQPGLRADQGPRWLARVVRLLAGFPRDAPDDPLPILLGSLTSQIQEVASAFSACTVNPAPPRPPRLDALVVRVVWASLDHLAVEVQAAERCGRQIGEWSPAQRSPPDPSAVRAAATIVLEPWMKLFGRHFPLEVFVPDDLLDLAFDEMEVRTSPVTRSRIGARAPVVQRVRRPMGFDPPAAGIRSARRDAFNALRLPVHVHGPTATIPAGPPPPAIRLDVSQADRATWYDFASTSEDLVVALLDRPPRGLPDPCVGFMLLSAEVPVVGWDRGDGEHIVHLFTDPVDDAPLADRLHRYRQAYPDARFTVCVQASPDDDEDLLVAPS
jgi:hypothetical protein